MKKLIDLPVMDVFKAMSHIQLPIPITVKCGLTYLMFMQAISAELERVNNDPSHILLERILEVAKEHGDYVEHDLSELHDGSLAQMMLENQVQGVLYTRLTYLTARLLAD